MLPGQLTRTHVHALPEPTSGAHSHSASSSLRVQNHCRYEWMDRLRAEVAATEFNREKEAHETFLKKLISGYGYKKQTEMLFPLTCKQSHPHCEFQIHPGLQFYPCKTHLRDSPLAKTDEKCSFSNAFSSISLCNVLGFVFFLSQLSFK